MKFLVTIFIIASWLTGNAQNAIRIFHMTSSHTSFPDTGRANGHLYNKILYDAANHYGDSSVLIVIPPNFNGDKKTNLVFWFHGWGNNIDSAAIRYDLIDQFVKSNVNAVLVLPETAKNAPDSYGGKLEKLNEFKGLVNDVVRKLAQEEVLKGKHGLGDIVLAGHSGAYRVMAYILQNGNVAVQEVILFDALYAETDKFIDWIKKDNAHRFINVYTNGGGTDAESKEMINKLRDENINTYSLEEHDLTPEILRLHPIVIIHSLHEHNDIIQQPDNFKLFLENSVLKNN